ncbi:hypothetical protein CIPAW_03G160700 [Carya illinoinensis]|uniref:Uncharacterized protein n=1 Tax=Carya illinoinensis TaxID=32201 RepID=A0A8T1R1N9_CARIL|nr:hypothetical protein CIPAW_03G160700 [Carya illinoinensis]
MLVPHIQNIICIISRNVIHLNLKKAYRNIVTSCLLGGPRKSLLTRCSRIQITTAIITKEAAVTHHISTVNGLRNTQALDFELRTGATMTRPVVAYGCEKSTIFVLFVTIAMSPTAASNT